MMTYGDAKKYRRALDGFVATIIESAAEINDFLPILREWKPGAYVVGDVRMYDGDPYKCVQPHDSTLNPTWTPAATPALWTQYHGTTVDTARPWIRPTGAQDMYHVGEYMIWTDGRVNECVMDTVYSPDEFPAAWQEVENVSI